MKSLFSKFVLIAILSIIITSCSKEDSIEAYKISEIKVNYSSMEFEILESINIHRIANNLSELVILDEISLESAKHTEYMIQQGEASHDNFASRRINLQSDTDAKLVGENVAFGYPTAEMAIEKWLQSEGHRKNLESSSYTHFGISIKKDSNGNNYFTNIFIRK